MKNIRSISISVDAYLKKYVKFTIFNFHLRTFARVFAMWDVSKNLIFTSLNSHSASYVERQWQRKLSSMLQMEFWGNGSFCSEAMTVCSFGPTFCMFPTLPYFHAKQTRQTWSRKLFKKMTSRFVTAKKWKKPDWNFDVVSPGIPCN